MKYARRKDANHREILDAFQAHGCGVLDVAGLADLGCDLIVLRGKEARLIEVKDGAKVPSARKLTDSEARLKLLHPQVWRIVATVEDVVRVVGEMAP